MHGNDLRVQYLQRRIGMYKTFGKHPSEQLQNMFMTHPYQIQTPEKAKVIFLSLDANWDINIENDSVYFNETLRYLSDGVKYWETEKIHTPMLKDNYNGDGTRYHKQFKKLGLTSENAKDICFMELLNVCTYGSSTKSENKSEYKKLLLCDNNKNHLQRIKQLAEDKDKLIIVVGSTSTEEYIRKLKLFDLSAENIMVVNHFSSSVTNEYLENLGKTIRKFLNKS